MPINYGLANLSHYSYMVTVVAYALAVLAFAGDFAFGRELPGSRKVARERAAGAELVAVGAGAAAGNAAAAGPAPASPGPGGAASADSGSAPPAGARPDGRQGPAERGMNGWVRVALTLAVLGLAAHITGVVARGLAVHRLPWGDMYEWVTTVTCVAVILFFALMLRYRAYRLGLFVFGPVVVLLGVAETVIYTPAGHIPVALMSYWLGIHVTAITLASGAFTVATLLTIAYLFASGHEKRAAAGLPTRGGTLFRRLPAVEVIDRLAYRTVLFGFPLWTFGIIAGAIWADEAWGRYWGWDPTETWAFITWVVYAGYLHARATAGWRGRRAAWIQLAGYACLIFNSTVISLLVTGLHSYAGLS